MIPRKLLSVVLSVFVLIAMTIPMITPLAAFAEDQPEAVAETETVEIVTEEGAGAENVEADTVEVTGPEVPAAEETIAAEAEEAEAPAAVAEEATKETAAKAPAKGTRAAEPKTDGPVAKVVTEEGAESEYDTLQAAINATSDTAKDIYLLTDIQESIIFNSNRIVRLRLGKHTLTSSGTTITVRGISTGLTVIGGTVESTATGDAGNAILVDDGNLVLDDCVVTSPSTVVRGIGRAKINIVDSGTVEASGNRAAIVIENESLVHVWPGGLVRNISSSGTSLGAIRLSSTSASTIEGTVTTAGGNGPAVIVSKGTLTVEDDAVITAGGTGPALQAGGINENPGTIKVNGGKISSANGASVAIGTSDSTFTINGGYFSDDIGNGDEYNRPECRALKEVTDGEHAGYYELQEDHDWDTEAVEISWNEDNTKCTATVVCKRDESHVLSETVTPTAEVTKEPTATEWGWTTYTANFTNEVLKDAVGEDNTLSQEDIEPLGVYKVTEGNGQTWTKGSGVSLDFHIEKTFHDDTTFDSFTGIKVDGKEVPTSEYKTEKGSVIVKIQPAYLEKLSKGKHEITAEFEDGSADADFTIEEGEVPIVPSTNDDANLGLFTLAMLTSLGALCGIAALKRRSE